MKIKKVIIIMAIIVLLIMILAGFAFAFTTTDLFKTDAQLFYKYLSPAVKQTEGLKNKGLEEYYSKLMKIPYSVDGKITVKVDMPQEIADEIPGLSKVKDLNITYSGKTNYVKAQSERNISINYSDDVSFPIDYKQNDNIFGLKSDLLMTQYIAISTKNLDELFKKYGISNDVNIQNVLENESDINIEELQELFEKIKSILRKNITTDNFSKTEDGAYVLSLNVRQVKNILMEILAELKNTSFGKEYKSEDIDYFIEELKKEEIDDEEEAIKIIVYNDGKITVLIQDLLTVNIITEDKGILIECITEETKFSIKIEKESLSNEFSYKINITLENEDIGNMNAYLDLKYTGFETETVKEEYTIGAKMEIEDEATNQIQKLGYEYKIDKTRTFDENITIEPMSNPIILNDASEEYIENLGNTLGIRFLEVNRNQMQQLGLSEEQNPLIFATPIGYAYYELMGGFNDIMDNAENAAERFQEQSEAEQEEYNILNTMNQTSKDSFNSQFTLYEGTQTSAGVKTLIEKVKTNNFINSSHIVTINGVSSDAMLDVLEGQLSDLESYWITIEIDEITGYVNSIKLYMI